MRVGRLQVALGAGLILGLLGCSTVVSSGQTYSVSKAGFASVKKAPASPAVPPPETDEVSQSFWRSPQVLFARQNNAEARALDARLRAEAPENFVEFRLSQEPDIHYLFSFLEDAETTLARYTSNPIFKPNTVKYTAEALEAKSSEFHAAVAVLYPEHNLESTSSVDILKGKVVAHLDLYEEDFKTFPTLDRFRYDPMVELNYNGPLDPPEVLSAQVAPLIRHFAHGTIQEPMVIFGYSGEGKIRLKDGCFFLDDGKRKDQLVVFPKRVGAVVDDEGYIALIDRSPHPGNKTTTRVGEPAQWYSGPKVITDLDILTPLRSACGQYDAVIIGAPMPRSTH